MKRECHGSCQHTSCQACSWVDPEPDCGACLPDDIHCIKRFAKCIKRSTCTRSKFPCKSIEVNGITYLLLNLDIAAYKVKCRIFPE